MYGCVSLMEMMLQVKEFSQKGIEFVSKGRESGGC